MNNDVSLSAVERYDLRYSWTTTGKGAKEEPLSLSSRIWAIVETIFSFLKVIFSFFSEDAMKVMKENILCGWTGVQYTKLQEMVDQHTELRGLDRWTTEFESTNVAMLRKLLDESPYPLDTLPFKNTLQIIPWSLEDLQSIQNQLRAPVTLVTQQAEQGCRADPAIAIKMCGQSTIGETIQTVIILWQPSSPGFSSSFMLTEMTNFMKDNKIVRALFFEPARGNFFGTVSEDAEGFQKLKTLLCKGQVTIGNTTWSLV